MTHIDPTTIRLSDSFLLSDFMGCDSVYRLGHRNQISDADLDKIDEGRYLAEVLDGAQVEFGPFSVTYGYISPELSRKIVTYQDPNKPSYHRWDAGAAADIVPHDWISRLYQSTYRHEADNSPVLFAHLLATHSLFSRMITYAESEVICFATRSSEVSHPRRAFYENRYIGERKPKHIKHPTDQRKLYKQFKELRLEHEWHGKGYPSYHGGGRKQFEHYRLNDLVLLSDLLYVPEQVHRGKINTPWHIGSKAACCFEDCLRDAADVLHFLVEHFGHRFSVVSGFERTKDPARNWTIRFRMELVPSRMVDVHDAADAVYDNFPEVSVLVRKMRKGEHRLVLTGPTHEDT